MKRHPPIPAVIVLLLAAVLLTAAAAPVQAHSTKGRIKIPLEKEKIGVDDVAYFVESYVHRELYKDRFEPSEKRFYVKEFVRVARDGPRADIHFIVLDVKEKTTFPGVMTLQRDSDGTWRYWAKNATAPLEVYTYVMKWGYYYQRYILPISMAGAGLALFLLVVLRLIKRRKGAPRCEEV
jgi:hypothetical protein